MAWVFHSGIFYYGVRKYIYESPVLEDKEQMISDALDAFLAGFERVFGTEASTRRAPGEAVGGGIPHHSRVPVPIKVAAGYSAGRGCFEVPALTRGMTLSGLTIMGCPPSSPSF